MSDPSHRQETSIANTEIENNLLDTLFLNLSIRETQKLSDKKRVRKKEIIVMVRTLTYKVFTVS